MGMESPSKKFVPGEQVLVRRGSGELEAGWIVEGYDKYQNDHVGVRKPTEEAGTYLHKAIPENELRKMQEEEK